MTDLEQRLDRMLRHLLRGEGSWESIGRQAIRIVDEVGLKRIRLADDLRQAMLEQGLVAINDRGVELTDLGRCRAIRSSGHADAFRLQHGSVGPAPDLADEKGGVPLVDDAESPLRWLHRRKGADGKPMVDGVEFAAGERLRAEFTRAGLMPSITSNWRDMAASGGGGPGGRAELADAAIAARGRVTRAIEALGPELGGVAIDVCCFLKGLEQVETERVWPARCAKVVLKLALQALARHYGLSGAAVGPARGGPARHWGASDYRPTVRTGRSPPA